MEMSDIPKEELNPWAPVTDSLIIAVLGKLMEELGECVTAASRCLIQGLGESNPETGKLNQNWLEEELADTLAMISSAIQYLKLNKKTINARETRKIKFRQTWFDSFIPF